jgi:hypothetical protein
MSNINTEKAKREPKRPSQMMMGFFYGWMAFYLFLKILEIFENK